jgi:malate dehydrogenase (quinone)
MLGVLEKCFPAQLDAWAPKLSAMVPSFGTQLSENPKIAEKTMAETAKALEIAR